MGALALPRGAPQRLSVAGAAVHIINSPFAEYLKAAGATAPPWVGGYILIGFDATPTPAKYDAIVPPFTEAVVNIPGNVGTLWLLYPLDQQARINMIGGLQADQITAQVDWAPCSVEPKFAAAPVQPVMNSAGIFRFWTDWYHTTYPAIAPPLAVLDQDLGNQVTFPITNPVFRPHVAPSTTDTIHAVTVANTLFDFTGPNAFLVSPTSKSYDTLLKRIYVSVSAATLFVLGQAGLAVGAPAASKEVIRYAFAGAGGQVFEFGEGLSVQYSQWDAAGAWRAYTSAAVTLDATVIGG